LFRYFPGSGGFWRFKSHGKTIIGRAAFVYAPVQDFIPYSAWPCAQEKLKENAIEAKRMAAGLVSAQQEAERQSNQKDDSGANMVSSADFERARAETRETASRLQLAEEQVSCSCSPISSSVQRSENFPREP